MYVEFHKGIGCCLAVYFSAMNKYIDKNKPWEPGQEKRKHSLSLETRFSINLIEGVRALFPV